MPQMPLFFAPQQAPPSSDSSSSSSSSSSQESESADDERELKKLHKGATEVKGLPKSRLQDVLEHIDNCFDSVLTAETTESTDSPGSLRLDPDAPDDQSELFQVHRGMEDCPCINAGPWLIPGNFVDTK